MRAYMRRGRRGAVAHVKVTWHATAANQYRGTVGCVRSRGGSEKRRSSQCVRGRQPHLVEESSSRETRAHPRTHTYTDTHTDTHTHAHTSRKAPRRRRSTGRFAFDAVCLLRDG